MKKLELKHIKPYLNSDVAYQAMVGRVELIGHIHSIDLSDNSVQLEPCAVNSYISHIKPILRPLSDLELDEFKNRIFNREYIIDKDTDSDLGYYEWCYLFENHFDVFGLIEKGLAIDINTLNK